MKTILTAAVVTLPLLLSGCGSVWILWTCTEPIYLWDTLF